VRVADTDSHERLAKLEQRVEHLENQANKVIDKLDGLHDILAQAKGVRWAILTVCGIGGFVVSGISLATKFLHWSSQ